MVPNEGRLVSLGGLEKPGGLVFLQPDVSCHAHQIKLAYTRTDQFRPVVVVKAYVVMYEQQYVGCTAGTNMLVVNCGQTLPVGVMDMNSHVRPISLAFQALPQRGLCPKRGFAQAGRSDEMNAP
jgi:hypothetical protein